MKSSEIRERPTDEIRRKLDQSYEELFNLRFQRASGQLEDFNRLTTLRRDIARMKTILRERELARLSAAQAGEIQKDGAA
jgi:large subunit ribosomal protein L29